MTETAAAPAQHKRVGLRYMPGIDGLRAISVLAVILYHHFEIGASITSWAPGGFLGVEVFFVVSGYLITALLLDERRRTGGVSLTHFWLRRARRLLPALYLLLAVVVAYTLLFLPQALEVLKGDVLAAIFYVSNWWQIFQGRDYFLAAQSPELLKHLWSLAIEEQFYVMWPLALVAGLRRFGRGRMLLYTMLAGFASAALMAILSIWVDLNFLYYATPTRMSGLLLGSALAFIWSPRRLRGRAAPGARIVLDVAGGLGLLVLLRAFGFFGWLPIVNLLPTFAFGNGVFRFGFLLVDLATIVVIAATVHPRSDLGRYLGVPLLSWIGLRSYGLYLWHYPIFAVTQQRDIDAFVRGLPFDLSLYPPNWLWLTIRVAITVALAELSYRYIETPIRNGAIGRYVARYAESHGSRRRALALRGAGMVALVVTVAFTLFAGVVFAEPARTGVHGIQDLAAEEEKNPVAPRAEALEALQNVLTTTTTDPAATTVPLPTTAPGAVVDPTATTLPPATAPATPPPTTAPVAVPAVLGMGDSVMLGAKAELEAALPGMVVDAVVSRQFAHAIPVLQYYRDNNIMPPVVVVHLGTNGRYGLPEFRHMMEVIGPDRPVYFLNSRMPRSWEPEVNNTLAAGVAEFPNAHLVNWHDYANCHVDWWARDGFHVTDAGAQGYANLVRAYVMNETDTLQWC